MCTTYVPFVSWVLHLFIRENSFFFGGAGAGVKVDYNKPTGFDRARNREVGKKDITLETLEEAFTSEHWIVRIFKAREGGT